jgi:hypothetical protein
MDLLDRFPSASLPTGAADSRWWRIRFQIDVQEAGHGLQSLAEVAVSTQKISSNDLDSDSNRRPNKT